ncbi:hypothetical protein PTKIN_Ptkin07bG0068800 [Pterospermum kingtungense]
MGVLKCNIDVAIFAASNSVRVGMVVRDDKGCFVVAHSCVFLTACSVKEVEVLGLCEALNWMPFLVSFCVVFELDAKVVVDVVNGSISDLSKFGALVERCQLLLSQNHNFEVCFVRRQANVIVYSLARASNFYASPMVFMVTPNCIWALFNEY